MRHSHMKVTIKNQWTVIGWLTGAAWILAVTAQAGNLDSPSSPYSADSAMYTLEDIYNRLNDGTPGVKRSGVFTEPGTVGVGTMHTTGDIMAKAPVKDTTLPNGAQSMHVLADKKFWGPYSAGEVTGTIARRTISANSSAILDGFYEETTLSDVEADLAEENILQGAVIFGVTGTLVRTTPAPVARTGQTTSYAAGDDGALQKGVAWPNPRFTDNGNGTVTDNLTGLIWLKNANAFGTRAWTNALTDCAALNSGEQGLTDGSAEGDWRLPSWNELHSLVDWKYSDPTLGNTEGTAKWTAGQPFTGVQSAVYWSGTTFKNSLSSSTNNAWYVNFSSGNELNATKTTASYVWPVRGGQ